MNAAAPMPKQRAGHAAVFYNGCLYVFGGKDDDNEKLNDLWKFNMTTRVWTELVTEDANMLGGAASKIPIARSGHTAVLYEGFICIFGGIFEVTKELNDLQLYDIANNRWICLFTETNEPGSSSSPTKAMAAGNSSPLHRSSNANKDHHSPRAGQQKQEIVKTSYQSAMQSNFQKNGNGPPKKLKISQKRSVLKRARNLRKSNWTHQPQQTCRGAC